jgi:hypothetical protein
MVSRGNSLYLGGSSDLESGGLSSRASSESTPLRKTIHLQSPKKLDIQTSVGVSEIVFYIRTL